MTYVTYYSDRDTYHERLRACADDPVRASLLELALELRSASEYYDREDGSDGILFSDPTGKLERAYEALGFEPL